MPSTDASQDGGLRATVRTHLEAAACFPRRAGFGPSPGAPGSRTRGGRDGDREGQCDGTPGGGPCGVLTGGVLSGGPFGNPEGGPSGTLTGGVLAGGPSGVPAVVACPRWPAWL
jgi:hypothetical protein